MQRCWEIHRWLGERGSSSPRSQMRTDNMIGRIPTFPCEKRHCDWTRFRPTFSRGRTSQHPKLKPPEPLPDPFGTKAPPSVARARWYRKHPKPTLIQPQHQPQPGPFPLFSTTSHHSAAANGHSMGLRENSVITTRATRTCFTSHFLFIQLPVCPLCSFMPTR